MKARDKVIALFAATVLGLLVVVWFSPTGLKQAPAVAFNTLDGRELSTAELRGQPLLVTFWATSCPGCMKEMPHLIEMYRELSPRGLEIVGVAMDYDSLDAVKELSKRRQIPYPIVHDTHSAAAQAFGEVKLTPTTFLIAPDGRIVQQTIGEIDLKKTRSDIIKMLSTVSG